MHDTIATVVVGYGLAGRAFHCPLIRRQSGLKLLGVVARDPQVRAQAISEGGDGLRAYAHLDLALADPDVELVVIATPHDTHADLAVRTLTAKRHCVVDKVMALSAREADAMIDARNRSGCLLSVFHNRRWDWDFLTVRDILAQGILGRPLLFESSVCRYAPPRAWRGSLAAAGTILHDWGAHLVDQALQLGLGPCRRLTAWLTPAPWEAVDSGGHGRIVLEFDDGILFQVESSRVCKLDRPRWWIVGTQGGFVKHGVDPQEEALRAGNIDAASEPPAHQGVLRGSFTDGTLCESPVTTVRGHWDSYYRNIVETIQGREELSVTAEQAREVVRVLDAAVQSSREHRVIEGPWGCT
jgi:scyllo-inositol 2-dehydrogenase (NADP+)